MCSSLDHLPRDGSEFELTVYPDGQLAESRLSDDDEDEDNDDEDAQGDDD